MATVNPARQMVGMADATSWPPKTIAFDAFYLIYLGSAPASKGWWSGGYITTLIHTCQWTWINLGTDLTTGTVGANRGNRYRTNMKMREELLSATFPWYIPKQEWSVLGSTPSGLALQGTPVSTGEYIWWTSPTFLNKMDKGSGVIYGAATVHITDMGKQLESAT